MNKFDPKKHYIKDQLTFNIISRIIPFHYLKKAEIELVQSFGVVLEFAQNTLILTQGKAGNGLYVILKGAADVTIRKLGEDTIKLAQYHSGAFFGEINLLNKTQCTASVIAASDTTCFFLPKTCFDSFSIGAASIRYRIMQALTENVVKRYRIINRNLQKLLTTVHKRKQQWGNINISTIHSEKEISLLHSISHFSQTELCQLINHSFLVSTQQAACIIKQNQKSPSSFLILHGAVQANIVSDDRMSHFVVHPPYTLIYPVALIDHQPEIFTYNTCGQAQLLEFKTEFIDWIKTNELDLWYKYYSLFSHYIFSLQRNLNNQINRLTHEGISNQNIPERILSKD